MTLLDNEMNQVFGETEWQPLSPLLQPLSLEYGQSIGMPYISLEEISQKYWLWSGGLEMKTFNSYLHLDKSIISEKKNSFNPKVLSQDNMQVKLMYLYKLIENTPDWPAPMIVAAKKIRRKDVSSRRSSYIGVSKNGPNWQSMISINKRKSYIGTFSSQQEAAEAFDYYSVLIHGGSAKTNYSYTKNQLMTLVSKLKN